MSVDAPHDVRSWTERHGLSTDPVSIGGYISPEYYQAEVDRLWKRSWLEVGRLHQLTNPGDYFVKDLPGLDASILVVRDKEGRIREVRPQVELYGRVTPPNAAPPCRLRMTPASDPR